MLKTKSNEKMLQKNQRDRRGNEKIFMFSVFLFEIWSFPLPEAASFLIRSDRFSKNMLICTLQMQSYFSSFLYFFCLSPFLLKQNAKIMEFFAAPRTVIKKRTHSSACSMFLFKFLYIWGNSVRIHWSFVILPDRLSGKMTNDKWILTEFPQIYKNLKKNMLQALLWVRFFITMRKWDKSGKKLQSCSR